MSSILGFLVLSTTLMAKWMHALPYAEGVPDGRLPGGERDLRRRGPRTRPVPLVQFATVAILWTGGNTSFNGFPYLANYVANDGYLPRQLSKRGHRLAFSNGILLLGVVALALILIFDADVTGLVSLYAIGVFTGFTMAGLGMVAHHRRGNGPHRTPRDHHQLDLGGHDVRGRAHLRGREVHRGGLDRRRPRPAHVPRAHPAAPPVLLGGQDPSREGGRRAEATALRRNVVYVLIDDYDLAAARAVQYARSLNPTELRAIHFDIDPR